MPHDPWRRGATAEQLRLLLTDQVLSPAVAERALQLATQTPSRSAWLTLLRAGLLVVGSTLTLAGVIFFFAYNWADLGRFEKLGLIAAGIVGATSVAWQRSGSLPGRVALFAACILEGALLAVYGQAYQTGADPYELFTAWMALILPWVIAARTPAFFALEVVLGNLALSLFWVQVLDVSNVDDPVMYLVQLAPNLLALAAWELYLRRWRPTDERRWFPRLLGAWCFALATWAAVVAVVEGSLAALHVLALLALGGMVAVVTRLFASGERQDLFLVTVAWGGAVVAIDTLIGRVLFDALDTGLFGFFLMGSLVIAEVGGLVALLLRLGRDGAPEVG